MINFTSLYMLFQSKKLWWNFFNLFLTYFQHQTTELPLKLSTFLSLSLHPNLNQKSLPLIKFKQRKQWRRCISRSNLRRPTNGCSANELHNPPLISQVKINMIFPLNCSIVNFQKLAPSHFRRPFPPHSFLWSLVPDHSEQTGLNCVVPAAGTQLPDWRPLYSKSDKFILIAGPSNVSN